MHRSNAKIAVCISGVPRSPHRSFCFVEELKKKYEVSVFCHHWLYTPSIVTNSWSKRNSNPDDILFLNHMMSGGRITRLESEDFDKKKREEFDDKFAVVPKERIWHPNMDNVCILSLYYSLMRADLLRRSYEKDNSMEFDCVFRSRFDGVVPKEFVIDDYDLSKVNIPSREFDCAGINDRMAFGNSRWMSIYSSVYLDLPNLALEAGYQPECILLAHLKKNMVPIERPEPDFPVII